MDKPTSEKNEKAEKILDDTKEELLGMLNAHATDDFGSPRAFLVFFEEDAKYRLRALELPEKLLKHYLARICEIFGPYSEDQPGHKNKYYDNDIYL